MRIDPQPFPQHDTLARENLCGINMEQDQPLVEFILYQYRVILFAKELRSLRRQ